MIQTNAEKYFTYLAKQAGMPEDGLPAHVQLCISMGLNEFWNAKKWSWATREYTLTWTSTTAKQELPSDFMGVRSVRDLSSPHGEKLTYKVVEEFDKLVPYPESHASTYPQFFTVVFDSKQKKWYAKMFNVPSSGMTTEWLYYTNIPDDIQRVPDKFVGGLTLCINKFLYKLGTPEQLQAVQQYYKVVLPTLEVMDNPFQGHLHQQYKGGQQQIVQQVPWFKRP